MRILVDGSECEVTEAACWAAAYGAACTCEILALIRVGNGFTFAMEMLDGEAAQLIADSAVRALRSSKGFAPAKGGR